MNEKIEIITEEFEVEKISSKALESFIIDQHAKDIVKREETLNYNYYASIINFLDAKETRYMNKQYEDLCERYDTFVNELEILRHENTNAEVKYNKLLLDHKKLNKQYEMNQDTIANSR